MNATRHTATATPGPWTVAGSCHIRQTVDGKWYHEAHIACADETMPCIAQVHCREYRDTERQALRADPEAAANARLIAAAPEMAEALRAMVGWADMFRDSLAYESGRKHIDAARAALEKAGAG